MKEIQFSTHQILNLSDFYKQLFSRKLFCQDYDKIFLQVWGELGVPW